MCCRDLLCSVTAAQRRRAPPSALPWRCHTEPTPLPPRRARLRQHPLPAGTGPPRCARGWWGGLGGASCATGSTASLVVTGRARQKNKAGVTSSCATGWFTQFEPPCALLHVISHTPRPFHARLAGHTPHPHVQPANMRCTHLYSLFARAMQSLRRMAWHPCCRHMAVRKSEMMVTRRDRRLGMGREGGMRDTTRSGSMYPPEWSSRAPAASGSSSRGPERSPYPSCSISNISV